MHACIDVGEACKWVRAGAGCDWPRPPEVKRKWLASLRRSKQRSSSTETPGAAARNSGKELQGSFFCCAGRRTR